MANQMNRHDTEEKILDLLEEIMNVYREYNPEGKYLTMTFSVGEGNQPYVSVNNAYWHGGDDENAVITASRYPGKEEAV